jgi:hypothetical protein
MGPVSAGHLIVIAAKKIWDGNVYEKERERERRRRRV